MIKMTKTSSIALAGAMALALTSAVPAMAAGDGPEITKKKWSFSGPGGHFDKNQLQRGFQVYREVCANCHSLKRIAFRNLSEAGGPEFSEAQVKALAAEYKIKDGPNDAGDMFERPGRASDRFPAPFANPEAARAALGAIPPDFSLLAKAFPMHKMLELLLE